MDLAKMYLLFENGDFNCHVSLPKGKSRSTSSSWCFQPTWNNMSQIGFIFPKHSGWTYKKIFETSPPGPRSSLTPSQQQLQPHPSSELEIFCSPPWPGLRLQGVLDKTFQLFHTQRRHPIRWGGPWSTPRVGRCRPVDGVWGDRWVWVENWMGLVWKKGGKQTRKRMAQFLS